MSAIDLIQCCFHEGRISDPVVNSSNTVSEGDSFCTSISNFALIALLK